MRNLRILTAICVTLASLNLALAAAAPRSGSFAENPIVYFVITDRFYSGSSANDNCYGRQKDGKDEIGTFHGGDLAGLTQKLKEGYFSDLGVNGIWITAPYEQIHGWVVGGDEAFKHYPYHGYFALDYTRLDCNMGTGEELREFIDTAHGQGIRVLFDVVMNHPGYGDLVSLKKYGVDVVWDGWEAANLSDYHSFIDYNSKKFVDWWGPDWVRAGLRGYQEGDQNDDLTMQLSYLPDFRTDGTEPVELPAFLDNKPDTRAETIKGYRVRDYLVKWLSDWVREYGVDGFRCDTAKHVELEVWKALKMEASGALQEWKLTNPNKKIDDADFWMVGEVFPHGVERSAYFDHGFDSIINFDFQDRAANLESIENIYANYAEELHGDPPFDVLTYISSHDTRLFDRTKLIEAGTALLLAPGGVQIFYGDETARPDGPFHTSDEQQASRSDMNWDKIDQKVLAHWQTLGQFRNRHVAIARGSHQQLAEHPYTFSRVYGEDRIVAALGVTAKTDIAVGQVFADGEAVRDAYSGTKLVVTHGSVTLTPASTGIVLLEGSSKN